MITEETLQKLEASEKASRGHQILIMDAQNMTPMDHWMSEATRWMLLMIEEVRRLQADASRLTYHHRKHGWEHPDMTDEERRVHSASGERIVLPRCPDCVEHDEFVRAAQP